MCIVFFSFHCNPPHPLMLLAFNRDEYFKRPAQPLNLWQDGSGVLAGRDLDGGGTWLGINAHSGRVAFLTNLRSRDPVAPSTHEHKQHSSRGELTTEFLKGNATPEEFVQSLRREQYHGFNLVVGDLKHDPRVGGAFIYTNNSRTGVTEASAGTTPTPNGQCDGGYQDSPGCSQAEQPHVQMLEPGRVYGLSNGVLMEWPKVTSGVEMMQGLLREITQDKGVPWDRLFTELLGDARRLVPPAEESNEALTVSAAIIEDSSAHPSRSPEPEGSRAPNGCCCGRIENSSDSNGEGSLAPEGMAVEAEVRSEGVAVAAEGGEGDLTVAAAAEVKVAAGGTASGFCNGNGNGNSNGNGKGGVVKYDLSYYARNVGHITSGRFVEVVDTPFGLYGTRSQTVIVVWPDGSAEARERHRHPDGEWRETAMPFRLDLSSQRV